MNEIIITNKQELRELIMSCLEMGFPKQIENPQPPKERILFLHDAARYLGLSPNTMYTYTHQNRIPFYKRGKKLYFKEEDLKNWLEQGKNQSLDEKKAETLKELDKKKGGKNG